MAGYLSKALYVLPARKSSLVVLLTLFIMVSTLEVVGIGLIGPFISLASNPAAIDQSPQLSWLYEQSGVASKTQFIALLGLIIVVTFFVKSFISWRVNIYVFSFSFRQQGELAKKLLKAYLEAPYTFHLSRNSASLIQNIAEYTEKYTRMVLLTMLTSSSNAIIVFSIAILLYVTNPIAVVAILAIVLPIGILLTFFKDKLREWGKLVGQANMNIIRIVNHSLGGIKETRVIGCESYFKAQFSEQVEIFKGATTEFFTFKILPRLLVENMVIVFLVGFTSIFLLLDRNIDSLIPVLGVFAIASIRLIPATNNLVNGISTMKNASYVLGRLYQDLKEIQQGQINGSIVPFSTPVEPNGKVNKRNNMDPLSNHPHQSKPFRDRIDLDNITYAYPEIEQNAIDGISLSIRKGESIALIGKSGAGKTTLVDVILGLLIPQRGDIRVDGTSVYDNLRGWQNRLGYIPQSIFLIDDTIAHNIAFGVSEADIDYDRLNDAIRAAQLQGLMDDLSEGINTMVGERGVRLSGGQRQRIGIARALYHQREILVLDEATSALDSETESLVNEAIRALGGTKTTIIIAHRLSTVEHCDRVFMMEKGRIARSGSYAEVVLGQHSA